MSSSTPNALKTYEGSKLALLQAVPLDSTASNLSLLAAAAVHLRLHPDSGPPPDIAISATEDDLNFAPPIIIRNLIFRTFFKKHGRIPAEFFRFIFFFLLSATFFKKHGRIPAEFFRFIFFFLLSAIAPPSSSASFSLYSGLPLPPLLLFFFPIFQSSFSSSSSSSSSLSTALQCNSFFFCFFFFEC